MHGSTRLAHRISQSGEIQENAQEHQDQYDGHPGGGHKEAGRRSQQTQVVFPNVLQICEMSHNLKYERVVFPSLILWYRKSTGVTNNNDDGSV